MADLSKKSMKWLVMTLAAATVVGCSGGGTEVSDAPPPVPAPQPVDLTKIIPSVDAGVRIGPALPSAATRQLAMGMPFVIRKDPMALLRQENAYEASQRAERFLQEGGFLTMWTPPAPPPDVAPTENIEPQPYRRLSGILVGDSVLAIVEMENGQTHIIRPGTRIPNTEWRVISVDSEKAILRRAGSRRPTQIVVKLENRPFGTGGGGNAPAGNQPPGGGGPVQGGGPDAPGGGPGRGGVGSG